MNTGYPKKIKIYRDKGIKEAYGDEELIINAVKDVEILIVHNAPVTSDVIAAGEKLKVIGVTRGGPVNVDLEAATKRKIPVINAVGRNSDNVADYTVGLIIALVRNIVKGHVSLINGMWDWKLREYENAGFELHGKTLGIIGFGQIGKRVALRMRKGFDMNILVYDPYVDENEIELFGGKKVDLETLLRNSDIITIHARLTPETTGLIGEKEIALMKKPVYLINTARSAIVDQKALYKALKERKITGAALDVFDEEPLSPDSPLLKLDNVIVTPHIAWISKEMPVRATKKVVEDIIRFLKGEKPKYLYNYTSSSE
jgi:D-3-phosphoglycerate dehydrogenase